MKTMDSLMRERDEEEARALAAEAALDLANQRIAALRRELGVAMDENKALTIDDAKYSQTSRGKLEAENARLRAALSMMADHCCCYTERCGAGCPLHIVADALGAAADPYCKCAAALAEPSAALAPLA